MNDRRDRAEFRFRLLGPLEVSALGHAVPLGGLRPRAVVACLLTADGRTVSEDALVECLWGDAPPDSARNSLQSHISRLRSSLGRVGGAELAGRLTREAGGYRLHTETAELDVGQVEMLLASARAERTNGHRRAAEGAAAAAGQLTEALSYWRGLPLADLADLPGWQASGLAATRTHLDALQSAVREELLDARLAAGWHAESLPELEHAAARQPMRERVHRLLALSLYRCGRHADALAVLRRYRHRLVEEAGLDPSAELSALEQAMLAQDPGLSAPPPEPAAEPPTAVPAGAPGADPVAFAYSMAPFVGRENELVSLDAGLSRSWLVTVTGAGGVGKTRLAMEWLMRAEGVASTVLELAALRRGDDIMPALASLLGVRAGAVPVEEAVFDHLARRPKLLVVDNCEHLVIEVAHLLHQLPVRAPGLRVLATSREKLGVDGEQVLPLAPLPVPLADSAGAHPPVRPATASVLLFADRAARAQPTFALTDTSRPLVERICRHLDGLPLAIELAAGQLGALGLADLDDRLGDRLDLLRGSGGRRGGRHATLRSVVDWSYALLPDPEQRLFELLSAFAGGFTLDAAERVVRGLSDVPGYEATPMTQFGVAPTMSRLVDASLVTTTDPGDGRLRYVLLETVRAYAAERLMARGASEGAARSHAGWVLDLAYASEYRLEGRDEAVWVRRLDCERANVRSAWHRAVESGDLDTAVRITVALTDYALWHGESEIWSWALRLVDDVDQVDAGRRSLLLGAAAHAANMQGDLDAGDRFAQAGLAAGSDEKRWCTTALAVRAMYRGEHDEAERRAQQALDAGCSPLWQVILLGTIAISRFYRGDMDGARSAVGLCRRRANTVGCPTGQAWASYADGEVARSDDPTRSAASLEDAIALARSVRATFVEGVATVSLASVAVRSGDRTRALQSFPEAIRHWQRAGMWVQQWTTLRLLVELLVGQGTDEPAAVLLAAADAAEEAPAVIGADRDRLETLRETLRSHLGAAGLARAVAEAEAMTPVEVVEYAMATVVSAASATETVAPGS